MTRYLYYHTDLTDRWRYNLMTDNQLQPHAVRLAALLTDDDSRIKRWSVLIRPLSQLSWSDDATAFHGVTREQAEQDGIDIWEAMKQFTDLAASAEAVVAFNAAHQGRVISRCMLDAGTSRHPFAMMQQICVMRLATDLVAKPRMEPGGGYLYPSFKETCRHFGIAYPSLDLDPRQRGHMLVTCVREIHKSITETNKKLRNHPHV